MTMAEAAPIGDIFITATSDINVLGAHVFEAMKSGAIMANSVTSTSRSTSRRWRACPSRCAVCMSSSTSTSSRTAAAACSAGEGRLVNLAAAEGHPSAVMDMSFANQALSAEYMVRNHASLKNTVYSVPAEIGAEMRGLKLAAMGVHIDVLTPEQEAYLNEWRMGT